MTIDRRRFSRIDFDARVELIQGDNHWHAQLLDISLKGVSLAKLGLYHVELNAPLLVKIILSNQSYIAMSTQLIQQSIEQLRLACHTIDINSVGHLRRLIELNLGDAEAAERELWELLSEENDGTMKVQ
ncbi:MAG: PilZ domain-containing protein [Pseudomonadota bacterium]